MLIQVYTSRGKKKEIRESVIRVYDYENINAPKVELNVCPISAEVLKSIESKLSVPDFRRSLTPITCSTNRECCPSRSSFVETIIANPMTTLGAAAATSRRFKGYLTCKAWD